MHQRIPLPADGAGLFSVAPPPGSATPEVFTHASNPVHAAR